MTEPLYIQHPLYIPTQKDEQQRSVVKQVLEHSVSTQRITLCEFSKLSLMLDSPDLENMNVVIVILEEKHNIKFV